MSETQAGDTVVYHARSGPLALAEGEAGDRSSYGKLTTKLAFGSAAALVVYIAGAGLTYCAQLALTRTIGANGYGVYAYVFAWVTALAYISALGFDVSLMRFVPAYLASRAFGLLRGVTRFARQRVAGVGCSVAVLGVVAILAQWGELSRDLGNTFVVGFALVPIMALVGSAPRSCGDLAAYSRHWRPIARCATACCSALSSSRGRVWDGGSTPLGRWRRPCSARRRGSGL